MFALQEPEVLRQEIEKGLSTDLKDLVAVYPEFEKELNAIKTKLTELTEDLTVADVNDMTETTVTV